MQHPEQRDGDAARLIATALLQEWTHCPMAEHHGKGDRCHGRKGDCTFTSALFGATVLLLKGDRKLMMTKETGGST
jgi:hypothetical protein